MYSSVDKLASVDGPGIGCELKLEDSFNGAEAGHTAGCQVIMVPDTIPANDRMREIADDIVELL